MEQDWVASGLQSNPCPIFFYLENLMKIIFDFFGVGVDFYFSGGGGVPHSIQFFVKVIF